MTGSIDTIIPAAGASRRLGFPKQLALIDGQSLLRRAALRALDADLGPVVIVLGHEAERLQQEVADLGCSVLVIDDWQEGMAASIRAGVAHAAAADGVEAALVMLVDQWALTVADLRWLATAWRSDTSAIAAAEYPDGTVGVPAIFSRDRFIDVQALHGDAGARHLLRAPGIALTRVPMITALPDLDRPG
jgi:CTP:molybdopterin cytidylyltransferase MocA